MAEPGQAAADSGEGPGTDIEFAAALIREGIVESRDVERAARLATREQETIYSVLGRIGVISELNLATAYARLMNVPLFDATHLPESPVQLSTISPRFLAEKRALVLARGDAAITVAVADPTDRYVLDALQLAAGVPVSLQVGEPTAIDRAIAELYEPAAKQQADAAEDNASLGEDVDVELLKDLASKAPVIRLVNQLISTAVDKRASDIHIEPFDKEFQVRMRIDGVLRVVEILPDQLRAAVTSRVKIMARLDIAERRLPQDGRAKTIARGKDINLRISTVPTMHGESIVIRVLDTGSVALDYAALGLSGPTRDYMQTMTSQPHGIFLVTGPTGSGKTTTLYAALASLDRTEKKVLTAEDPIEYQLDGVNHVQTKPSIGLDFAALLRSFLRQDPDVILVGEIRDTETAQIAAQAALTGHLVLSTLHTNEAASAVTRLIDMGVEPFLLTATLNGVAAQRLVRRLCPSCREAYTPEDAVIDEFAITQDSPQLYRATGCGDCDNRGFKGRTVIMECLTMTRRVRRLILERGETDDIRNAAMADGMLPMFEDGVLKALAGDTTLEEVIRATRVS
ncbi:MULTISPECIES: GspE/PulE family protein [unclassified Marinovum]